MGSRARRQRWSITPPPHCAVKCCLRPSRWPYRGTTRRRWRQRGDARIVAGRVKTSVREPGAVLLNVEIGTSGRSGGSTELGWAWARQRHNDLGFGAGPHPSHPRLPDMAVGGSRRRLIQWRGPDRLGASQQFPVSVPVRVSPLVRTGRVGSWSSCNGREAL